MMTNRIALALLSALAALPVLFVLGMALRLAPRELSEHTNAAPTNGDALEVRPGPVVADFGDDLFAVSPVDMGDGLDPAPLGGEATAHRSGDFLFATNATEPALPDKVEFDGRGTDLFGAEAAELSVAQPAVRYADGAASTSLRNADFPNTYLSRIEVDLTSPNHFVRLTWTGPQAARQETGPFHGSPGAGIGNNNCDDMAECNRQDSNCTPKGTFSVEAFSDYMRTYPTCRFVTWFQTTRGIAFHSHSQVPRYPASHGCVRLNAHAAQLIHNNSLIGKTEVTVGGTWTRYPSY